ncbi:MAG: glycosyltransferase family 4 protein [Bacteroidota bacterium]
MAALKNSILMLVENNSYPGDTRVRREALALVDAGFHVTVIAPRALGQPKRDVVDDVHVYRYPEPTERDSFWGFVWEFLYSTIVAFIVSFSVWRKEGFDVIHAHNPPDTLFAIGLFYKLFGKKFVFDHHDLAPELYMARTGGKGNKLVYNVLRLLERWSFRTADLVIATNESYKKIALTRGGVAESKVKIVRNGPPLSFMDYVQPYPELVNMPKSIFGYAGSIGIQDGLDYFIKALHHLKTSLNRDDFLAIIMGDGDDVPRIKAMTREYGLEDHVQFTGWLKKEKLMRYLTSIDIGVDPDPSNDFNDKCTMIKMTEYMAFSKPIIAFDLPEHRFTSKDAAMYVPDNNTEKFGEALAQLMDDEARRNEMGLIGRQRVEQSIAWEYSVPKLVDAYINVLGFKTARMPEAIKPQLVSDSNV